MEVEMEMETLSTLRHLSTAYVVPYGPVPVHNTNPHHSCLSAQATVGILMMREMLIFHLDRSERVRNEGGTLKCGRGLATT